VALIIFNIGGFVVNQNFLTISELADVLKVKKSFLYSRTRETGPGSIPRLRVGKYIRFELDKVLNWLKSQNESEQ